MIKMRLIGVAIATLALTACTATYDKFIYEVTESSAKEVRVQTHAGMQRMEPEEVQRGFAHMQQLATAECGKYGKSKAVFIGKREYTTGPYYSWLEHKYSCR